MHEKNFRILKGRKFTVNKFPELEQVYNNENTYVIFPSESAINLQEFRQLVNLNEKNLSENNPEQEIDDRKIFHVILIDGTWPQASGIFYTNHNLHGLKQVIWKVCYFKLKN